MEVVFTPCGLANVLVGEVIRFRVPGVERNGRAQRVNVVRWRLVTRAIRFRDVSFTVFQVVMGHVLFRNYFRFIQRYDAFFDWVEFLISYVRGFNDFTR